MPFRAESSRKVHAAPIAARHLVCNTESSRRVLFLAQEELRTAQH